VTNGIIESIQQYHDVAIIPNIIYEPHSDIYMRLSTTISEKDVKYIVGTYNGGLLGYYLSNLYKIPALLFNPLMDDYLKLIPRTTKSVLFYDKKMIVFGNSVNTEKLLNILPKMYSEDYIKIIDNELDFDIQINKFDDYFKKFIVSYRE
jgi:predicted esterase YcpF (UPF0227 family)